MKDMSTFPPLEKFLRRPLTAHTHQRALRKRLSLVPASITSKQWRNQAWRFGKVRVSFFVVFHLKEGEEQNYKSFIDFKWRAITLKKETASGKTVAVGGQLQPI